MPKIFEEAILRSRKKFGKSSTLGWTPMTEIQHAAYFAVYVRPEELFVYKSRYGETGITHNYGEILKEMNLAYAPESICEPFNDVVQRELYDAMNKVLKRHHLL